MSRPYIPDEISNITFFVYPKNMGSFSEKIRQIKPLKRLNVVNDYFLFGIQVGVKILILSCLKNLNIFARVKLN